MLFIGFFYTMPQMKGAGTTLAYSFPGLPYQAGVVLVGSVITLNVALGGVKGAQNDQQQLIVVTVSDKEGLVGAAEKGKQLAQLGLAVRTRCRMHA